MRRLLPLTLAALLASTTWIQPAHAFAIFGAIASFIGFTGVAATVAATVLEVGAAVGLSYLAKALAPKPQTLSISNLPGGTSGKLQFGGAVPRSFIVGRYATAGSLVYANTYSAASASMTLADLQAAGLPAFASGAINPLQAQGNTPNAYLTQVIALSDLPVTGLAGVLVNSVAVTWNPSATPDFEGVPIPEFAKDGKNHLWVRFYDGTQTTADPILAQMFPADPNRPYGSDRIGTGVAYAVVTALVENTLFTGFPSLKFVLDGIKLYDRRYDSTAGGSGSQRWSDSSTWVLTANPVVITENILRGISYKGAWLYGAQTVSAAQLPAASWTAAASECDVAIGLAAGGTEPQFVAGGEISLDAQPADTLDELLKACNGRLAEIGGTYKMRVGAAGAAVFSFTDGDILSTEQQTFDPFPGLQQTINAVTAKYISPDEGWNEKDAPPLYDAALEAADGGRRQPVDVQYSFVTSGTQVQRLMQSERDTQRAFRKHTLPLPPDAFVLEPLDVVSWTSTRNGYVAKTFDVLTMDDLPNLNVGSSMQEINPNAYDWTPSTDEKPVSTGTIVVVRPPSQPIVSWSVEPYTIDSDNDQQVAAIRLNWDPNTDDVRGIRYEVRLASSQEVVLSGSYDDNVKAGTYIISQNLVSDTDYEARGQYVPISSRDTEWSDWLPVTTPDVRVTAASLSDAINATLATVGPTFDATMDVIKSINSDAGFDPSSPLALSTGLIINPVKFNFDQLAEAATANILRTAQIEQTLRSANIFVNPDAGTVDILALDQHKEAFTAYQSEVSAEFDAVNSDISLRATVTQLNDTAAAIAAGFDPAYRWEFNGTDEGWTASGGTITPQSGSVIVVDVAGAGCYIQSPTLALNADKNGLSQIKLRQTAGTEFSAVIQYGDSYQYSSPFETPTDPTQWTTIPNIMSGDTGWTGTITSFRIALGVSNGDTYEIDYIEVGASQFQQLVLGDLDSRVTTAEENISGLQGDIDLKASQVDLDSLGLRMGTAETDIDGINDTITNLATSASVSTLGTEVTTVQNTIDALAGSMTTVIDSTRETEQERDNAEATIRALLNGQTNLDLQNTQHASAMQTLSSNIDAEGVARAEAVLALQTQVNNNAAAISTEQQTRSDSVSANSQSITQLSAQVNGKTATVTIDIGNTTVIHWPAHGLGDGTILLFTSTGHLPTGMAPGIAYYVINVQYTADTFAISTTPTGLPLVTSGTQAGVQTAAVAALSASVSYEAVARATQTDTMAANITTLQVQVGDYAQTETIGEVVTNLYASYSITLDVNGHLGGLVLNNNGQATTLSILGDVIVKGSITGDRIDGKTITGDNIAGVTISADKLVLGGVSYEQLASGAASVQVQTTFAAGNSLHSSLSPPVTKYSLGGSQTITTIGGNVDVSMDTVIVNDNTGNEQAGLTGVTTLEIWCDGVSMKSWATTTGPGAFTEFLICQSYRLTGLTDGNHQIEVTISSNCTRSTGEGGGGGTTWSAGQVRLTNVRR